MDEVRNGAKVICIVVKHPGKLSTTASENLEAKIRKAFAGTECASTPVIVLEEGATLEVAIRP